MRIAIVIGIARIRSADAPAHTLSLAIRSKAEPLSRQCMSGLNSLVRGRRGSEDVVEELLRIQLRLPLAIPLHIVCVARTRQAEKARCLHGNQRRHECFQPSTHNGFFRQVSLWTHLHVVCPYMTEDQQDCICLQANTHLALIIKRSVESAYIQIDTLERLR